jgi:hypothetical protein
MYTAVEAWNLSYYFVFISIQIVFISIRITQNSIEVDAETKESTTKTEEKLDGRCKEGHERKKPK